MSIEPTKEEEPNSIVIITSNVISTNKKVTVMRIVHTNDCAECGEQFGNQSPFFKHVLNSHNLKQTIEHRFKIPANKATDNNPDLHNAERSGQVFSKETCITGQS